MEKIATLKERLAKAEAKKAAAEAEIATLKKKIEQAESSAILATLKEHNIGFDELAKLLEERRAGQDISDLITEANE